MASAGNGPFGICSDCGESLELRVYGCNRCAAGKEPDPPRRDACIALHELTAHDIVMPPVQRDPTSKARFEEALRRIVMERTRDDSQGRAAWFASRARRIALRECSWWDDASPNERRGFIFAMDADGVPNAEIARLTGTSVGAVGNMRATVRARSDWNVPRPRCNRRSDAGDLGRPLPLADDRVLIGRDDGRPGSGAMPGFTALIASVLALSWAEDSPAGSEPRRSSSARW